MKAWMLDPKTNRLELVEKAMPKPRRGGVTVRIQAAMVLGRRNLRRIRGVARRPPNAD
jgi:D-arabinose 1-dehydrogenase-like Zn-dependent alcohol dehydrogenase